MLLRTRDALRFLLPFPGWSGAIRPVAMRAVKFICCLQLRTPLLAVRLVRCVVGESAARKAWQLRQTGWLVMWSRRGCPEPSPVGHPINEHSASCGGRSRHTHRRMTVKNQSNLLAIRHGQSLRASAQYTRTHAREG